MVNMTWYEGRSVNNNSGGVSTCTKMNSLGADLLDLFTNHTRAEYSFAFFRENPGITLELDRGFLRP